MFDSLAYLSIVGSFGWDGLTELSLVLFHMSKENGNDFFFALIFFACCLFIIKNSKVNKLTKRVLL